MNYCEICLRRHGAKKNQATSQKSLGYLTTLASQSVELFGQEDENSSFQNILLDLHNNSDKLLNQGCL